jgi:hypothetical protein
MTSTIGQLEDGLPGAPINSKSAFPGCQFGEEIAKGAMITSREVT